MQSAPDFAAFEATYAAGRAQVVHTALIADLETPVSAFLKLAEGKPNSFLFESVEGGSIIGRYSFLGLRPDLIWRCRGQPAATHRRARFDAASIDTISARVLSSPRPVAPASRPGPPGRMPPRPLVLLAHLSHYPRPLL